MIDDQSPAWSGAVHPAALIFPMMSEVELDDLAKDVGVHGLIEPLKLHPETGALLDGRNRLEACLRANVEPRFEIADLNGGGEIEYVASMNVKRRHLTVGPTAIMAAKAWDIYAVKQGRPAGKSARSEPLSTRDLLAAVFGVGANAIQQARALVQRDPVAAEAVANGMTTLSEAFESLRQREREREEYDRRLAAIRADSPDLVDRIDAGNMSLGEAESVIAQRRERVAAWVQRIRDALHVLARMAGYPVPAGLTDPLTDEERRQLTVVLAALAKEPPAA